jgi:hypothetical protein
MGIRFAESPNVTDAHQTTATAQHLHQTHRLDSATYVHMDGLLRANDRTNKRNFEKHQHAA